MKPTEDMIRASGDAYSLMTEWLRFAEATGDADAEGDAHKAFWTLASEVVADKHPHANLVLTCLCGNINRLLAAEALHTGKTRQQVLQELAASSAGWGEDQRGH